MTTGIRRIAVLVGVARHKVSGVACYSRNDALALEMGRTLAEANGMALDVIHAGERSSPALADYLALGAPSIDVLECGVDADVVGPLADRLQGVSLVLTGTRAEGGHDSGMLPYRLAARLGYALVDAALALEIEGGEVLVTQALPKGVRRRVAAGLPAVVAVHPQAAATPRYAYARSVTGAIAHRTATAAVDPEAAQWRTGPVERKPRRLTAPEKRSGHARMLGATTTESRGGNVVIDGTSVEKAQVILDYLREHRLIDY
jgi:electron transfer flavoprotein beta subunit